MREVKYRLLKRNDIILITSKQGIKLHVVYFGIVFRIDENGRLVVSSECIKYSDCIGCKYPCQIYFDGEYLSNKGCKIFLAGQLKEANGKFVVLEPREIKTKRLKGS